MADESIGTARIDIIVDTDKFDAAVARAKTLTSQMGDSGEAAYQKLNAGAKRATTALLQWTENLGKTAEEQRLVNAAVRGVPVEAIELARKAILGQRDAALAAKQAIIDQSDAVKAAAQLQAEAATEAANRTAQARAQEVAAIERGTAAMAAALAQQRRLESMRADAAHAFGPEMAAREREISEMQRSNSVRDRLTAFLATERGQRIANAEAIRNQNAAYATGAAAVHRYGTDASKAFAGTNKSARELQFAMRGLPAQFTDIFVSLASGQRPMMVLLQQGGQLKDMFGGVGPALRAMGSGILAMINPLTLSAAAVAGLGAAFVSAENDQTAFNKALLTTGGYAGKTASQMEAMVGSIAATANVTQGSAREALQKVAETGRFTGAQFDLVAVAAARMESATGQSIDSTIKKFEELAKSPVDALLKLNETEHFLTDAQLERVRALMAEGKEQEAAAEAARIYADRLDDVGKAAEAARPHLSKLWSDAWKEIDAVVERTKNFAEFLAAAADKYKEMPWYKRMTPVGALSSLYGAEPATPAVIAPVAGAIDSNQAKASIKLQEDAAKFKDRYLTREQEKTRELAELDKMRAQYSEQEYQSLKKQIDLKFAEKPKRGKADPFNTLNGLVQDAQAFDQGVGVDADQNKQAAAIRKIVDAGAKLIASGHDMATVQATVAVGVEKLNDGYAKQAAILRSQNVVSLNAYRDAIKQQVADKQRQIDLEVASIGMGEKEAQQQLAVAEIYARVNKTIEQLNRQRSQKNANTEFIEGEIAAQKASIPVMVKQEQDKWRAISAAQADGMNGVQAAIKNFMGQQKDMAGQMSDLTTKLIGGFGDAFASFASGAESAKSAFGSLIDDMYRQALKFLANKAIQGIFDSFSATGGGSKNSTPGSSAGGWGSILGNIVNAFTTKSANGNVFTSSGLSAYSGQVVSQPTMFAFAHGAGLMGEAGPEAIMPLRRLPNGKLGVEASNSRPESAPRNYRETTINVNVQPTSTRRTADQVAQTVARRQRMAQARNG